MMFNFIYFVLCCVIATPLLPMAPHEPSTRSTDFASPAELLSELSIFGFSLLSPKDQQDKIEQISNKLVAEDVDVGSLPAAAAAGETEEDVRRKAFAMLFNKAPVVTRVELFKEFTKKFFVERRLCEQQEKIDEIKQSRYAEFYLGLSIIWFKARCASDPRNLIQVVVGKAGVDDHIFEKLVNETEEDFKLRRFTESFKQLQFSSQEDIVEFIQDAVFRDLVDDVSDTLETREDESDTSEAREDVSDTSETSEDVSNTFEVSDVSNSEDVSNTRDSVSGNVTVITSRKRFRDTAIKVGIHNIGNATPSRPFWEPSLELIKMSIPDPICGGGVSSDFDCDKICAGGHGGGYGGHDFGGAHVGGHRDHFGGPRAHFGGPRFVLSRKLCRQFGEPLREEFIKMSIPDPKGPRGATATQGGEQGAITQGGQGTSQQ